MIYTIRLNNSIFGWTLIPVSDNASEILNELYFADFAKMKPSERAFGKGDSIEKAIAHIKEVCAGLNIKVSFCGKKTNPTIRLWWSPITATEPIKISVDLKWSCWTTDQGIWEEYAPGALAQMEAAFKGDGRPVRISTGPRKEIRFGGVLISKGKAEGYFCTEWDDCESLADTLNTECDDAFRSMIPFSVHNMEPGHDWDFKVKARSFAKLMERIDNEENNLLQHDEREWNYIAACFRRASTEQGETNAEVVH